MSKISTNSQCVLITGFKPFAGRPINGSETIARSLERTKGHNFIVKILDVAWGSPEQFIPGWISRYSPSLIIGLGEGAGNRLKIEQKAFNRAEGIDENGQSPPNSPHLDLNGPDSLHSTLRIDPEWHDQHPQCTLSDDAGSFLCNNWLYTSLRSSSVATGFIHLPVQSETTEADYIETWRPLLLHIIEINLYQQ